MIVSGHSLSITMRIWSENDRDGAFQMAERSRPEDVDLGERTIGQEARLMNKMLAMPVAFFLAASPNNRVRPRRRRRRGRGRRRSRGRIGRGSGCVRWGRGCVGWVNRDGRSNCRHGHGVNGREPRPAARQAPRRYPQIRVRPRNPSSVLGTSNTGISQSGRSETTRRCPQIPSSPANPLRLGVRTSVQPDRQALRLGRDP